MLIELFVAVAFIAAWLILESVCRRLDRKREAPKASEAAEKAGSAPSERAAKDSRDAGDIAHTH